MGQALAFNMWRTIEKRSPLKGSKQFPTRIMVIEKDPTLQNSSTTLSVGGIRQQFSEASNVQLSMLTADFLRDINRELSVVEEQEKVDVQFNPHGYLLLASEKGSKQLMENYETQTNEGAKVMLLNRERLEQTYPWLNLEGLELGSLGLENEGWFDPSLFVNAFKTKLKTFPIINVQGEVVGTKRKKFTGENTSYGEYIDGVYIKLADEDKPVFIQADRVVNCAGSEARKFAEMCGIGAEETRDHAWLKHSLPVERKKRYVYVVHCPDAPMLDMPMVCDPSGFYVRREGFGGKYLVGKSPSADEEPDVGDLEVNYDFFNEQIWPDLAHRIPAFNNLKVISAWAGYYDYNTFDQNAIIGDHPWLRNIFFMNGFSGHGIQQAYGATKTLAELMVNGEVKSANIEPFTFDRICEGKRFIEKNII